MTPLTLVARARSLPLVSAPSRVLARRHHRGTRRRRRAGRPLYAPLALPSFDVAVDDHLVRIRRESADCFLFESMAASILSTPSASPNGFSAACLDHDGLLAGGPDAVLWPERRAHLGGVLARQEVNRSDSACRRLRVRVAQGKCRLSPWLQSRVVGADGVQARQPMPDLLNEPLMTNHVEQLKDVEARVARRASQAARLRARRHYRMH